MPSSIDLEPFLGSEEKRGTDLHEHRIVVSLSQSVARVCILLTLSLTLPITRRKSVELGVLNFALLSIFVSILTIPYLYSILTCKYGLLI